jgi:long-subunit fatty acid transport protein
MPAENDMRPTSVASTVLAIALAVPAHVHAGGFEFPGPGTRALGRGGAFAARSDDPMTLRYDPASLSALPDHQVSLQVHQVFASTCFQRQTELAAEMDTYNAAGAGMLFSTFDAPGATSPGDWAFGTPLPEVCQENMLNLSPDLVATIKITEQIGIGFGLLAPAGAAILHYGDDENGNVEVNGRMLPGPQRYTLVDQAALIAFPSVGIGYSPIPELRFGATFHWGLGSVSFMNYTRATEGENPADDVKTEIDATDWFIPGFVLSVHAVPVDFLDITLAFEWSDSFRGGGEMTLTTGAFGVGVEGTPRESTIATPNTFPIGFEAPISPRLRFGIRFSDRISPRQREDGDVQQLSNRVEDSMSNERWDIELDAVYEFASAVDTLYVRVPAGTAVDIVNIGPTGLRGMQRIEIPQTVPLPHKWHDQLSLSLGGDWNILPGLFTARLGASFETQGINSPYAWLDFLPSLRFGAHVGATLRLGQLDISLAYAHFFQTDIEVGREEARVPQVVAGLAMPQIPGIDGRKVNAGTYTSSYDALSLGLNYHFF